MPQTARKSTGGHAPRSESPLDPPDWLSTATTGVLILRNEQGRCEATWSGAPFGRTLNMNWGDRVEDAMLPSDEDHYWFEDIDGDPYHPYSDLGDVMGDEDGWVKVYIRTKGGLQEGNQRGNDKKRRKRSSSTPTGDFEDYTLGFIGQDDGKVVVTWGACLLSVPGTWSFGLVIGSLAQMQGITVSSADGSIIAHGVEVEEDWSLATALGSQCKTQTVTVSLRTV